MRSLLAAALLVVGACSSPSTPSACNAGASCFCTAATQGTIECTASGARCACPSDPSSDKSGPSACAGYVDEDGDGFGAGPLIDDGCPARTHLATKNGDCADRDARAFPGQTGFFFEPVANFNETGHYSWDFNCDGREEPHWTATGTCTSCPTTFAQETWIAAAAPSCGAVEQLATACATDSSNACVPTARSAAQECR